MKHLRSSAEQIIRDATVERFRKLWPDARIIHEMNVEHGTSRADVVAVQPDRIWIAEIKSERDKLDRLRGQVADFAPACHGLIVVAHEKWTKSPGVETLKRGATRHLPSPLDVALTGTRGRCGVWVYPETRHDSGYRSWLPPHNAQTPWFHRMLMLLWADELRAVASDHCISCGPRTPAYKLAPEISRLLPGRDIERAVCQQLRSRRFAEADPPVLPDKPEEETPRYERSA